MTTVISPAAMATTLMAVMLTTQVLVTDSSTAMTMLSNLTTLTLTKADNVTSSSLSAVDSTSLSCVFDPSSNSTLCGTDVTTLEPADRIPNSVWLTVVLGILAGIVSLVTILGNITVLLAFGLERTIRQPTNYFLASLAVSDLLIGTFSMPLYTQYLLFGVWPLGPWLCDLWLSLDWTVCLTSQYTVFLITMDRFLSVKIPARYRNWRTEHKVLIMISITWILPALVFFTSIIGWQYFVGKRTVAEKECEVQFMNDVMFTFFLTIGYFWITLFVIGILYGGIYKVALDLQRKSDAKHKKLQTTMELAAEGPNSHPLPGGHSGDGHGDGGASGAGSNNNSSGTDSIKGNQNNRHGRGGKHSASNRKSVRAALPCPPGAQINTTSFTTKGGDKDEDRSSSPAFASDDDNSSSGGAVVTPKPPPPALSSGVYIGRPNPSAGIVNTALFANTGGLVRSLHGDLFFGPADTQENQTLTQSPPPSYSEAVDANQKSLYAQNGSSSNPEATATNTTEGEYDGMYSSALSPDNEKQTKPLLEDEIMKGCRFIDEQSFMETMTSENSALLPVISHLNSESRDFDESGNDGNAASSPIWKRRTSLLSVGHDDYDIDDDFITGDPTTNTTTLTSSVFKHIDDEDDEENEGNYQGEGNAPFNQANAHERPGDVKNAHRESNSISSAHETMANHHVSPSGASNAASNTANNAYGNNTPAGMSETNEDSSRSDIHCLSAATRRRCNKDTRLHTLVKSVRSRNSRKRNRRERKSKSENRARKALRTISIILGAFVLCWTPYHIIIMVMALCKNCVPIQVYAFTYWMCYLNSPINPFCYAFANAQFKRTFIRIMRFDWHRT